MNPQKFRFLHGLGERILRHLANELARFRNKYSKYVEYLECLAFEFRVTGAPPSCTRLVLLQYTVSVRRRRWLLFPRFKQSPIEGVKH